MNTKLNWRRRLFSNTCEIYSHGTPVGRLNENTWKHLAYGELNRKKYIFKTTGFFKQETMIINTDTQKSVGKITYNFWKTKAEINYFDRVMNWRYDNSWNTRWSIVDSSGVKFKYQGTHTKGTIDLEELDELLILTGLHIKNYYWHTTVAVLIAVFVPIWISAIH